MRVRYEVKFTLEVAEEPDNRFPIEALEDALRPDDGEDNVLFSKVETKRTVLGPGEDGEADGDDERGGL